ncbi:IS1634 family transposase [Methanoplanus endosymbiosus]|uniref:IS1634 family transposase n=1 Tax=Methanoplanus endosymbiosus TaxID=33865 RepID=A0A9E7PKR3_9EURY|nr:IS1634 family transposase [Methanoplanus endosymbiosus]UUX91893.1 IS1634 family transposase [Methanoplanus endosymbiosus]
MTEIVLKAVRKFDIEMDQFHNDSTSITFYGNYEDANGEDQRGKSTLNITHGHNKDHRPDLKQLVFDLTVSSDGAIPIHYKNYDGNRTDDTTHIDTWDTLRKIKGDTEFIYVADSKLCVTETMKHIDKEGGFFITILPKTRSEEKWFRDHVAENKVSWDEICKVQNPRDKKGQTITWKMVESPICSKEGFRIVWAWNSKKEEIDQNRRQKRIDKSILELEELQKRLESKRCCLKTKQAVSQEVETIIEATGTKRWIDVEIDEISKISYKQEKRGRPTKDTKYVANTKVQYQVKWKINDVNVKTDARSDGMFPLITNCKEMTHGEILEKYKYQPKIEKRHEQLKTVYGVAPIFLKNITRIEALLFIYFVAHLVQSLIEREIRINMKKSGMESIPIYPEKRQCASPTTDRVLGLFDDMKCQHLTNDGTLVKTFNPKLNDIQITILDLLNMPHSTYSQYY